jgi:hypothetical protein
MSSLMRCEGRGEMIKAPTDLQELSQRIYIKGKAESSWGSSVRLSVGGSGVCLGRRSMVESNSDLIGPIKLDAKCAGKRSAVNPHAAFEEAGAGNGATDIPTRARRGKPRIQTRDALPATAPALDPTSRYPPSISASPWVSAKTNCAAVNRAIRARATARSP